MGRVRRYKKYKACDPCSKRGDSRVDSKHDEPPDIFDQNERSRSKRRQHLDWDNEEDRELLLQREALREMKQPSSKRESNLEGKKDSESMKAFTNRIKQETRLTLKEEISKLTSTAKKRKLRLNERKMKRKLKKGGRQTTDDDEQESEFFGSAENGSIRASDRGGAASFASKEAIAFGEVVDRPPDLIRLSTKLAPRKPNGQGSAEAVQQGSTESAGAAGQKRKRVLHLDALLGGSGGGGAGGAGAGGKPSASQAELDRSRVEAMAAYKQLKTRRIMSGAMTAREKKQQLQQMASADEFTKVTRLPNFGVNANPFG